MATCTGAGMPCAFTVAGMKRWSGATARKGTSKAMASTCTRRRTASDRILGRVMAEPAGARPSRCWCHGRLRDFLRVPIDVKISRRFTYDGSMTIGHAESLAAKLRSGRILLGGHRGNADECPENTLASFRSAIELGVDVIELDVHRSEDGGLPVIPDRLLARTTDGSGLVRDHTMAELKRFDAGSWKDPRFRGERIPSLDEVLAVAKGRVGVAIEIKNLPLPYPGIEDAIVQTVREAGMVGGVVVISFDHPSVKRIAWSA